MADPAAFVRRYLGAISAGATGPTLAAFFDPEATIEELPSQFAPAGATRDLAGILDAAERGKKLLAGQTFEVKAIMAGGDRIAVETLWTGKLAAAFGTRKAGEELRARVAMFLELRNGRILRQRNYDCYDAM